LAGLTAEERINLDLRVYIANTDPSSHPLYGSSLLSLTNSVVSAENVTSSPRLENLIFLERNEIYIEKSAWDFSLALEHCYLNSTADYIGLFEGDIVAANSWFARTQLALREVETVSTNRHQDWLDLRLFNDAKEIRWTAYRFGRSNIPMIALFLPILFAALSGITYFWLSLFRRTAFGSKSLSQQTVKTICLITIPLFLILFFQTGHLSTIPRPSGVSVQSWGCCTQGEIFPRSKVPNLISQLRHRAKRSPADITVWDHASDGHLLRFVLDPPMVQHVGFTSVSAPKRKKNKSVWSVSFEDLDAEKLEEEHETILEKLYG
jgi:hypothetical protein